MSPMDMSGPQKVAALLLLLGDDVAGQVLSHCTDREIERVHDAMCEIKHVDESLGTAILQEYDSRVRRAAASERGGPERARRIMRQVRPGSLPEMEEEEPEETPDHDAPHPLADVPPAALAELLDGESPQAVALLLAHMPPEVSARVLAEWPEERMAEVALRIGKLQGADPTVVSQITDALGERLGDLQPEEEGESGVERLGGILGVIDRKLARGLVSELEKTDAELAEAVRAKMFSFDLLLRIEDRGIQEILKQVEQKQIGIALKGGDEDIAERIFNNMSERASQMLKEEMEYLGTPKVADIEAAQKEVMQVLARLEEDGVVTIETGAGE